MRPAPNSSDIHGRKRQLQFATPEVSATDSPRIVPASAGDADIRQSKAIHMSQYERPKTHEGSINFEHDSYSNPSAPSTSKSGTARSYQTLSPRQISLKIPASEPLHRSNDREDSKSSNESSSLLQRQQSAPQQPQRIERPATSHHGRAVRSHNSEIRSAVTVSAEVIASEKLSKQQGATNTLTNQSLYTKARNFLSNRPQSMSAGTSGFIRPSTASTAVKRESAFKEELVAAAVRRVAPGIADLSSIDLITNYPSLSHRLNASIQTRAPAINSIDAAKQRAAVVAAPDGAPLAHQRRNATNMNRGSLPQTLALPTRTDTYNEALRLQHSDKRILAGEVDDDENLFMDSDELSAASTIFNDMEMDDVLDYLLAAREPGSTNAKFVHVTPRYHVEYVPKSNYYDLVVLERPGNPSSGLVWMRGRTLKDKMNYLQVGYSNINLEGTSATGAGLVQPDRKQADRQVYSQGHQVLKPSHVMQLSLHGLLVSESDEQINSISSKKGSDRRGSRETSTAMLIPLREFMLERSQLEYLRTGRFFGCFQELKTFTAWKMYTRSRSLHRTRAKLLKHTYFADELLVAAYLEVGSASYDILNEVRLFHFHGAGAICITEFIKQQHERNALVRADIINRIDLIGNSLSQKFEDFSNSDRLQKMQQEIKDHHPLKNLIAAGDESIDLAKMRSLHRIRHEFKDKLRRIFFLAQYRVDYCIARLLEVFWMRFKQLILGVKRYTRSKVQDMTHYWELDRTLFDDDRKLLPMVQQRYNTDDLFIEEKNYHFSSGETSDSTSRVPFSSTPSVTAAAGPSSAVASTAATPVAAAVPFQHRKRSLLDVISAAKDGAAHIDDDLPDVDARAFHYARGSEKGLRISSDWQQAGCHLCVDINLCFGRRVIELNDFITLNTIDKLKVMVLPGRTNLNNQMHRLCGDIGDLLKSLPSLKKHPLIHDRQFEMQIDPLDNDLEMGDLAHQNSAVYFTTIMMNPIYNSLGGYGLAVDVLRTVQVAYQEAAGLDSYLFKLFEIVRKLWALAPTQLGKQTERSLVLSKIKEYIENPDTVDDVRRLQTRDKGRVVAYKNASTYLSHIRDIIQGFDDIKHASGFITSFRPFVEQISYYRSIQEHLLYARLPVSFNNRCSVFYDFIRKLETSIELNASEFDTLVDLMRRLRNFEHMTEYFEGECEVCEQMFSVIQQHSAAVEEHVPTAHDHRIAQLFTSRGAHRNAPTLSALKLFTVFSDSRENLITTMNKARSLILGQISQVKADVMTRKYRLHGRIKELLISLEEYQYAFTDKIPADVSAFLKHAGTEVETLQTEVSQMISAQEILIEAHDIVGAAMPIFKPAELDVFPNMDKLQQAYEIRRLVWYCLSTSDSLDNYLMDAKLVNNKIREWSASFVDISQKHHYLLSKLEDDQVLNRIKVLIVDLQPKVEMASFLSSNTLRPRHWKWLSAHAFTPCGLAFKFTGRNNEFISVMDVRGKEPMGLGNLNRLAISELVSRGALEHIEQMRSITSEAVIESSLEGTLDQVESTLSKFRIQASGDWLRDSRLREKIFIELSQVVNLSHLNAMVKYCMKAIIMVENTSQDMSLSTFDIRVEKLKLFVQKIEKFVMQLGDVQKMWFYLLHFVKFSGRGEIDRETIRMYNQCTEDLKKLELVLLQRSDSLLTAFSSGNDADLNSEALRGNLSSIMEDAHSCIQSMLDACPRLSLLSYNRLVALYRQWMMGAQFSVSLVSSCLHDMFEGVGRVIINVHPIRRQYICAGFISHDSVETVYFEEPVAFNLSLDLFVQQFEYQLRLAMEMSCDEIVLHRINCLKALLFEFPSNIVLSNIRSVFAQRVSQIVAILSDSHPNECYYLINSVSFTEDVWTALGHPTGCVIISRPDLSVEQVAFAKAWRSTLQQLHSVIEENISTMQQMLSEGRSYPKIRKEKAHALLSSLMLQEIAFLRTVEELRECKCLESASEMWAGRYQLRFQYQKTERYRNCPIEVNLGSISIPYGMEYSGPHIRTIPNLQLEQALERVLSSSFSSRGSVFISYEKGGSSNSSADGGSLFEMPGEYAVCCGDIAAALGKITVTLSLTENSKVAVQFFLARLVYLDAIGCFDFSNIDHGSLQILIDSLTTFWNAIDNKNDQFIQDSHKFPLKTRFSRNDLHADRRKQNINSLRESITVLKRANRYPGLLVIGLASETFYSSISVFDHFYRSIFNPISIPNNQPMQQLGILLSVRGFQFGMDIQKTLMSALIRLNLTTTASTANSNSGGGGVGVFVRERIVKRICTLRELKLLVDHAVRALNLYLVSNTKLQSGLVGRFKVELQCLCAVLWDRIVILSCEEDGIDLKGLRNDLFLEFYKKLETISSGSDVITFDKDLGSNDVQVEYAVNNAILSSASRTGLVCNFDFVHKCGLLWNHLTNKAVTAVILTGDAAVGKTSVRTTVVNAIRTFGMQHNVLFGESWPVRCIRAAQMIFKLLRAAVVDKKVGSTTAAATSRQAVDGAVQQYATAAESNQSEVQGQSLQSGDSMIRRSFMAPTEAAVPPPSGGAAVPSKEQVDADAKKQRLQAQRRKSRRKIEVEAESVHVSVIYHASLTVSQFLGQFDSAGRWSDGLLIRKLRSIDEMQTSALKTTASEAAAGVSSFSSTSDCSMNVVVLNGPIGYYVEQLFSSIFFLHAGTFNLTSPEYTKRSLSFPNGEVHSLGSDVKIVVEANDVRHASPACFVHIPMLMIKVEPLVTMKNLLTCWMRSAINWFGDFPPWLDFLDFLADLLLNKKFVADLVVDDGINDMENVPNVIIVTRVSAFLRFLEDLLQRCHTLALVDANFVKPDDADSDDSSSDDSQYDSDSDLSSDGAGSTDGAAAGVNTARYRKSNGGSPSHQQQRDADEVLESLLVRNSPHVKGAMFIHAKARELLVKRARYSIIYAAIWGLGSGINVSERYKVFDNAIRDAVLDFFDDEVPLPTQCSVFECEFDLNECIFEPAVQRDLLTKKQISVLGMPAKYEDLHMYAEVVGDLIHSTSDQLIFHSKESRAVESALRMLLGTGANVLLVGARGCGKSLMISRILQDLKQKCPTPRDMRKQISSNLVDIVNGVKRAEGIFAALEILRYILSRFSTAAPCLDGEIQFTDLWQLAGEGLKVAWSENARLSCEQQMVSSCSTSLRGHNTASALRKWFSREFATENTNVLETSRFSYGMAFIDDMHVSAQQYELEDMRRLQDRPEALLKGIMEVTPLSAMHRYVAVRSAVTLGVHDGQHRVIATSASRRNVLRSGGGGVNGSGGGSHLQGTRAPHEAFPHALCDTPVMHLGNSSDPRLQSIELSDEFVLQRMGVISAASGELKQMQQSSCFAQVLPHFCVVGLPSQTVTQLHASLNCGALVSMGATRASASIALNSHYEDDASSSSSGSRVVDLLKHEIAELSRVTMTVCSRMVAPVSDNVLTSPMERAIRSVVVIDVSLVARFCMSLRYGANNVSNPGSLLQLYAHEWKRYFLDPLPAGPQRDRIVELLSEQLGGFDEHTWSISREWLQLLQEDFAAHKDRVWTDARIFELARSTEEPAATDQSADEKHENDAVATSAVALNATSVAGGGKDKNTATGKDKNARQKLLKVDAGSRSSHGTPQPSPSINKTPKSGGKKGFFKVKTVKGGKKGKKREKHDQNDTEDKTYAASSTDEFDTDVDEARTPTGADNDADADAVEAHLLAELEEGAGYKAGGEKVEQLRPEQRIYLPVELDRFGTERSLTGGAWESTLKMFRPVLGVDEITQGKVFKELDFSSIVGAGDVRKVLYPAAISLVMRMVRIIAVAGRHMMIAGYYGGTRMSALHLAAKICDLEPITFDAKYTLGALEGVPHENAQYSMNFTRFLKGAVYKAAGLIPSSVNAEEDVPAGQNPAYVVGTAQRLFAVVSGCQQLPASDRQLLLNLIDYEDPGTLFSDLEIAGISDALQEQLKLQLAAKDLYSTEQRQPAASLLVGNHAAGGSDPVSNMGDSEAAVAAAATITQTHTSSQHSRQKSQFNGYIFQFVKEFLKERVKENLTIVLDVDFCRAMKLSTVADDGSDLVDAAATLRKMTANSSSQRRRAQRAQEVILQQQQEHQPAMGSKPSSASTKQKRFSLISGRSQEAAVPSQLLYDPTAHHAMHTANPQSLEAGQEQHQSSNGGESMGASGSGNAQAQGIFSCPILGPLINRRFCVLWYDVDGIDAVKGICTTLMKNERYPLKAYCHSSHWQYMQHQYSPITLSLRTSAIGMYLPAHDDQSVAMAAATVLSSDGSSKTKSSNDVMTRRLSLKSKRISPEELQRIEFESFRRSMFKSRAVLERYNFHIKTNRYDHIYSATVLIQHLGVFKAFQTDIALEESKETSISESVAALIDEARAILPHVLTVKTVADALLFRSPVLCPGPESMAQTAADTVMFLIRCGSPVILRRKYILETTLQGYEEALSALRNTQLIDSKLIANNEELAKVNRGLSSECAARRREILNVSSIHKKTVHFERECMLSEDIVSVRAEAYAIVIEMEALINATRQQLKEFTAADWQEFTLPFSTAKTPKVYLELMRALMVAINFIPPKVNKSEKAGKMDDEMVAKCATALLGKHADLCNQLCAVVPAEISPAHLKALRIMNLLINSDIALQIDHQSNDAVQRMQWMATSYSETVAASIASSLLETNNTENKPGAEPNSVYAAIRSYLILLDVSVSIAERREEMLLPISVLDHDLFEVVRGNEQRQKDLENQLKAQLEALQGRLYEIDAVMAKNRLKIEANERNSRNSAQLVRGIMQSRAFVLEELRQVKRVLKYLVSDCCVAVTVLVRAGWLCEQLRQECMEQIRKSLRAFRVQVSDSPLVLGHLLDGRQIRQWTPLTDCAPSTSSISAQPHSGALLPRDPASLNSLSLVYLAPLFALIVDPDGTASTILSNDIALEGFDRYSITAQKFSLALFETWVQSTVDHNPSDPCLNVVITDLQAGASDDLVCLLACDFLTDSHFYAEVDAEPISASTAAAAAENNRSDVLKSGSSRQEGGTADIFGDAQASFASTDTIPAESRSFGLTFVINPSLDLIDEATAASIPDTAGATTTADGLVDAEGSTLSPPSQRRDNGPTDLAEESTTMLGPKHTIGSRHKHTIRVPCRLRLYLISSEAPSMNALGMSHPIPTCALKHVTVINWSVNTAQTAYIDSRPAQSVTHKQFVSDQVLSSRLTIALCRRLSPTHLQYTAAVNHILVNDIRRLHDMEDRVIKSAYNWMNKQREKSMSELRISGVIEQTGVSLSMLEDEEVLACLVNAMADRRALTIDIEMNRSLLRELNEYFSTLSDVFAMSVDFIRMCSTFLPKEIFSPYALTSSSIYTSFLLPTLHLADRRRFLKGLPSSLFEMARIRSAIIKLQETARRRALAANSTDNSEQVSGDASSGNPVLAVVAASAIDAQQQSLRAGENSPRRQHQNRVLAAGKSFEVSHQRFGLRSVSRQQAVTDLSCLLSPLRAFLLREMVSYVQLSMRPGMEWIAKLLLLFTTWAQSPASALPVEEIRALINFVLEAEGRELVRYGQYIPYHGLDDFSNNLHRFAERTRALSSGITPSGRRMRSGHSLQQQPQQIARSSRDRILLSGGGALLNSQAIDDTLDVEQESGDEGDDSRYDAFLEQLPTAGSMKARVTAFRINEETFKPTAPMRYSRVMNSSGGDIEDVTDSTSLLDASSNDAIPFDQKDGSCCIEKGLGLIDGLWINSRSSRWRVMEKTSKQQSKLVHQWQSAQQQQDAYQMIMRGSCMFADRSESLAPKNRMLLPPARTGDEFEVEWLKARGVRLFSTAGVVGANALGELPAAAAEELKLKRKASVRSNTLLHHHDAKVAPTGASASVSAQMTPFQAIAAKKAPSAGGTAVGGLIALQSSISRRSSSRKSSTAPTTSRNESSLISTKTSFTSRHGRLSFIGHTQSILKDLAKDQSSAVGAGSNRPNRVSMITSAATLTELVVSARTSHSGRVTQALSSMTAGIGEHRHSLLSTSRLQSARNTGMSVASTNSASSRFSKRISSARARSGRSSVVNLPPPPAAADVVDEHGEEIVMEELSDLLTHPQAFRNMLVLENHSQLAATFKGMSSGIVRNITEFADWKQTLQQLMNIDPIKFSDRDLANLLFSIKPPNFEDSAMVDSTGAAAADAHTSNTATAVATDADHLTDEGLWLKGYELTIIQTMLLSEAIAPGSCKYLSEVYFALVASYLRRDGHIVQHPDEYTPEDDDDDDDEDEDLDSDAEELETLHEAEDEFEGHHEASDFFDGDLISVHLKSSQKLNKRSSIASRSNSTSSVEEFSAPTIAEYDSGKLSHRGSMIRSSAATAATAQAASARSSFFRRLEDFNHTAKVIPQDGVARVNSWTRLERVLNGTSNARGPQIKPRSDSEDNDQLKQSNESQMSCRDYENWESVLLDVLSEDLGMEKYVFMKQLRDATFGTKSCIFLCNHVNSSQIAVFSQRARDLAVHNYDNMAVVNCHLPATTSAAVSISKGTNVVGGSSSGNNRQHLMDVIRRIRVAIQQHRAKRTIVEMLDLTSPQGNAILSAVLLHGAHGQSGTCTRFDDGIGRKELSLNELHFVVRRDDDLYYSGDADALAAVPSAGVSSSTATANRTGANRTGAWYRSFPLIASAEWGSVVDGRSPFISMADLSYTWLPRYIAPDVVRIFDASVGSHISSGDSMSTQDVTMVPSLAESCGVLCEELESALLFVMNANKSIAKSRITNEIRSRLRRARRIEFRVTSAIVTIWQLVQYLRCANREDTDVPAVWSGCLNPASLWQLARLMLKIADIMEATWDGDVQQLLRQERFSKAIWLLAESFSNTECNIYSTTQHFNNPVSATASTNATSGAAAPVGMSRGSSPGRSASASGIARRSATAGGSMRPNPPPSMLIAHAGKGSPLIGARRLAPGAGTAPQANERRPTVVATGSTEQKGKQRTGYISFLARNLSLTHQQDVGSDLSSKMSSSIAANARKLSAVALPSGLDPNSQRAKKLMKKTLKQLEESRNEFVRSLVSIDRFSIPSRHSNSINDPSYSIGSGSLTIEKDFINRFISFLGVYLARVIVEIRDGIQTGAAAQPIGASSSSSNGGVLAVFKEVTQLAIEARRQSNKINIKSFLSADSLTVGDEFESWPDVNENVDVALGSLSADDVLKVMVKWTFNGGELVQSSEEGRTRRAVNKAKIARSIRLLSMQIKQGKMSLND